jgi:hypothetical protein
MFNNKENKMGMKPKAESRSGQVRAFLAKNPNMLSADVARSMGEDIAFVRQVVYRLKHKLKPIKVAKSFKDIPKLLGKVWEGEIAPQKAESDMVNHPEHYKVGGIETIDFIEAKKLDYNLGNAVKYISRADHKGERIQDLKKALWYIERAIMASHIG